MGKLYIDGIEVEGSDEIQVAQTFQINDPQDLTARYISYSNTVSIHNTRTNRKNLKIIDLLNSASNKIYSRLSAHYVNNGINTFRGQCAFTKLGNRFSLNLFESTIEFFDIIREKLLSQLVFPSSSAWANSDQDTARSATTGLVAPYINYGRVGATSINHTFNLPSVYYHSVLERLFTEAGYNYDGSIFTHEQYLNLIIPFSKDSYTYDDQFADDHNFLFYLRNGSFTTSASGEVEAYDAIGGVLSAVKIDTKGFCTASRYVVPSANPYAFQTKFIAKGSIQVNSISATSISVRIRNAGSTLDSYTFPAGTGPKSFYLETSDQTLGTGSNSDIYVQFVQNGAGNTDVSQVTIYFSNETSNEIDNTKFNIGSILPDMKQIDFVADFLVRFNLLVKEKNGTLYFKSVDEIATDRSGSKDWTSKRDETNTTPDVDLLPNGFAQNNYFKYSKTDDLTNSEYGLGNFDINNDTLPEKRNYYTSSFNSSKDLLISGGTITCAHVPVYDGTSVTQLDFVNEPGLRLAMVRSKYGHEANVTYNGSSRSDYLVAYFVDEQQDYHTGYQSFIDTHYRIIKQSYQLYKAVTRVYNLSDLDINRLDLFVPIFDNGNYFIVSKVGNYISGQLTKVLLLKV